MTLPEIRANREKRYSLDRFGFASPFDDGPSCVDRVVDADGSAFGDVFLVEDAYRCVLWRTTTPEAPKGRSA